MMLRRPSAGSGRRSIRPRSSRAPSVAPTDWGLMRSNRASSAPVVGPTRSSRARAEVSDAVRSSSATWGCRKRWKSRRTLACSAPATSSTKGSWVSDISSA